MEISIENIKKLIVLADVVIDVEKIDVNKSLVEQGIDSLEFVNICLVIEETFGIKIPDEDLEDLNTINNIIDYVRSKSNLNQI
ncbi:acyl carrier protein [Sulfurospirillum diekertiae]|uniref:Acyl carrier protein n=1 Tax=Sulfurospirillum diekertiae TaxID=1854492 RepID=A0A6G9VPK4_9BACT|nr:phosphopantetheine-binding protein [Sulfurospirillum diekertiae]QIR75447.1 acyl carrier protein [Sulfurospirillum diekertiae]QIR78095.1 acyl carrier protein [Sulfurospirillum diekertiae]